MSHFLFGFPFFAFLIILLQLGMHCFFLSLSLCVQPSWAAREAEGRQQWFLGCFAQVGEVGAVSEPVPVRVHEQSGCSLRADFNEKLYFKKLQSLLS